MRQKEEEMKLSQIPRIVSKIFNEGVYKENYTLDKAIKALSNCAGSKYLTEILIEKEDKIKESLISKTQVTY